MKTTRRTFLKTGALAAAGSAFLSNSLLAMPKKGELLGIQLYSVRDEMGKDPLGTLKQIAAIGYKNVEHANYVQHKFYGYEPAEFKKILADLGLKMPSGHTGLQEAHWDKAKNDFTDDWKKTVDNAALLGQEIVISPSMDHSFYEDYDKLKWFMGIFNKSGELCQKAGMKFGYHNHHEEFSKSLDGKQVYDIIMAETDPKLVIQQLDIGNMMAGGAKAMDIINKYPGRFLSMHVKDEIKSTTDAAGIESTVLGTGIADAKMVTDAARKKAGTKHFIVEQESYQGKAPIDAVKEDFAVMKKWGY
ncbi:MAG: TIM barrel protein [Mucilaginibacter polytrichastri]|nr:TIM barrel protein [Mucilaginibacter polytrichastri]